MAKVTFQWQGVPELMKTLDAAGVSIDDKDPAIKQIIMTPAAAMVANAKSLAPISEAGSTRKTKKGGTKLYPPGTLRNSIIATPGPANQRGVFIVARKRVAPYAVFVELGTSKMAARPFFRPALLQMGSTYAQDIAPGVKQILESAAAANAKHS